MGVPSTCMNNKILITRYTYVIKAYQQVNFTFPDGAWIKTSVSKQRSLSVTCLTKWNHSLDQSRKWQSTKSNGIQFRTTSDFFACLDYFPSRGKLWNSNSSIPGSSYITILKSIVIFVKKKNHLTLTELVFHKHFAWRSSYRLRLQPRRRKEKKPSAREVKSPQWLPLP